MWKKALLALLPLSMPLAAFTPNTYHLECCRVLCPYITVGAGAVFPAKNGDSKVNSTSVVFSPTVPGVSAISLPNVLWKNHYQVGYEVFGALGCSLNRCVRMEAEFIYQGFQRKVGGSYSFLEVNAATQQLFVMTNGNQLHHATSHTNVYAGLSNIYFDHKWNDCLTISVGGGFGAAWIHSSGVTKPQLLHVMSFNPPLDETSSTLEKVPVLTGSSYAWQFKISGTYEFSRCFSLGLGYRLLGTGRFQSAPSDIIVNPGTSAQRSLTIPQHDIAGLLNNSVDISLRYLF